MKSLELRLDITVVPFFKLSRVILNKQKEENQDAMLAVLVSSTISSSS
jgi:hypothetical protein